MLTSKAIDLFLNSRYSKNDEPSTIDWYKIILSFYQAEYEVLPTDPESIDLFLKKCKGGDERRHGFYRTLRAFYHFLERRYDIPNPVRKVDPPRRVKKLPKALMLEDFVKLFTYSHCPRTMAYLDFLSDTGCRISELHGLKPEDINHTPWGYIARLRCKKRERYVPLLDCTYDEIIKFIPVPYCLDYFGNLISEAFKDAGVEGSAHCLRHTFATLWDSSEFALQQILGHANFEMLRNYRNLRTRKLSELHKENSPLLLIKSMAKEH